MKEKMELSKRLAVSFIICLLLITACTGKQLETKVENNQDHSQYREALAKLEEGNKIIKTEKSASNNSKAIKGWH